MRYRNVFVDFHHGSLLNSLILLFKKRLGADVYRPIGLEWFEKGFWKINDQRDTAEQFLGLGSVPSDGTPPLNTMAENSPRENGVYVMRDTIDAYNLAIGFDAFMQIPFDIVIASIPQHIEPFRRLCDLHPLHPRLIYQVGNQWNITPEQTKMLDAVMASANIVLPEQIPGIVYHQEFDLQIFSPFTQIITEYGKLTFPEKNIFSFVNCFNTERLFAEDWDIFQKVENAMPDWHFKSFGGQCRDGNMSGARNLAVKMRESRFIWHTKHFGDGYGHILHNAAAVARPIITKLEDYRGKMGQDLLIDGETCIAIDNLSIHDIYKKIEYYSEPGRYAKMSRDVFANFQKVVNFDYEEKQIRSFLYDLK